MQTCPFFGKCGGCRYDFASTDYRLKKHQDLELNCATDSPVWIDDGTRRRADFCFAGGNFGFFEAHSKNIVVLDRCPVLHPRINEILPIVAGLPWAGAGAGSCLITLCDNGIDITIVSNVPFFSTEFRNACDKIDAIRMTWNGKVIKQTAIPMVRFGDKVVEYPAGAFLQPTLQSESIIRDMVVSSAQGFHHIADLFCGLGNYTFALGADGFDIVGHGQKRDLFKNPLGVKMLNTYDCVVMDPPRAGALEQCVQLAKSKVKCVIYVSCNPRTWTRDARVLERGGYMLEKCIPVDQFLGSSHWEIFSVFTKSCE